MKTKGPIPKTQKYIVKRYEQSPFNQDGVSKNILILCNKKNGEPIAELSCLEKTNVQEGDILLQEDIILEQTSKRSKHIVVGDCVQFRDHIGVVEKIEEVSEDEDYWDDKFHLKDCKHVLEILGDKPKKDVKRNQIIKRRDLEAKPWLVFTINMSDEKKWARIEKEWLEINKYLNVKPDEVIAFFKNRTNPK